MALNFQYGIRVLYTFATIWLRNNLSWKNKKTSPDPRNETCTEFAISVTPRKLVKSARKIIGVTNCHLSLSSTRVPESLPLHRFLRRTLCRTLRRTLRILTTEHVRSLQFILKKSYCTTYRIVLYVSTMRSVPWDFCERNSCRESIIILANTKSRRSTRRKHHFDRTQTIREAPNPATQSLLLSSCLYCLLTQSESRSFETINDKVGLSSNIRQYKYFTRNAFHETPEASCRFFFRSRRVKITTKAAEDRGSQSKILGMAILQLGALSTTIPEYFQV